MDTTITGIGEFVVAQLRSAGYMESTIGQYEKSIRALTGYARRQGTSVYTPALGAGFASLTTSPRTGRFSVQRRFDYRRLVAVFDSYVTTGRVDLSVRKRGGGGPQPAEPVRGAGRVVGSRHGRPRPGCGDARGLRPGGPRLPVLPRIERDLRPRCRRRRHRAGVLGIVVAEVGEDLAVLGGVELPAVSGVHRPIRPGRRGESGRCAALAPDGAGP